MTQLSGKICVGIDVGSTASKAVVLRNGEIVSFFIGQSTLSPTKKAREVFEKSINEAGISENQVNYIVGTGYGRGKIQFADDNISEITCHARGAHFVLPDVRTIIDVGGQDSKAISLGKNGTVLEFVMNDKCAAGTGRFLEFMARSMDLEIPQMAELHKEDAIPAIISSMCSVFAESEVINLINEEIPLPCIVKGLHKSVASRVSTLVRRVGMIEDIVVTGGVAKNAGVLASLEETLKCRFVSFPAHVDPQIIGALGAAVIGSEKI